MRVFQSSPLSYQQEPLEPLQQTATFYFPKKVKLSPQRVYSRSPQRPDSHVNSYQRRQSPPIFEQNSYYHPQKQIPIDSSTSPRKLKFPNLLNKSNESTNKNPNTNSLSPNRDKINYYKKQNLPALPLVFGFESKQNLSRQGSPNQRSFLKGKQQVAILNRLFTKNQN